MMMVMSAAGLLRTADAVALQRVLNGGSDLL
jgi:hypothetical protein